MAKYTRPALLTAALWGAAVAPALAQTASAKPKTDAVAPASAAVKPVGDADIVGSVNGKPITWGQVVARLRADDPEGLKTAVAQVVGVKAANVLVSPAAPAQVTITRAEALDAVHAQPSQPVTNQLQFMLTEQALDIEAAKAGVSIPASQVDEKISKLIKDARVKSNIPASVTDDQFLTQARVTRSRLIHNTRAQLQIQALIRKDIETTLGHPIGAGDYLQARHILVKVDAPAPDAKPEDTKKADDAALAKITQVAADLKANKKTFEAAAKESSDDPGTKDQGGELGVFARGMMVKPFEQVAFTLKPNELSAPVRTDFGYHLIQVEKLGSDLTPDQRQATLDRYESSRGQAFLGDLLNKRVKVVNNLRPPQQADVRGPNGMPLRRMPPVRVNATRDPKP